MENSDQTPQDVQTEVRNQHGSGAVIHGQPGLLAQVPLRTMNSTAAGANQPATVQIMFLEDSDISPISFPENKGRQSPWKFSNFARALKRGAKPMSPKVLPAHKR